MICGPDRYGYEHHGAVQSLYELPVEGTCWNNVLPVNVMSLMTLLCLKWEMMKRQCSQRHSMSSRTVV
jgi:hypothetical protein